MNSFFTQAGVFLVQLVFGLYLLAVLLRFLFQVVHADFYNPAAQFVVALTNPLLRPLRRVIPGLFGIDIASLLLLLILQTLEIYLISLLLDRSPSIEGLIVVAVVELIVLTLYVYVVAIIVRSLLSWVVPYGGHRNPISGLLMSLTEPLLRPARRWIPTAGGVDLSPLGVLALLWLGIMAVRTFL